METLYQLAAPEVVDRALGALVGAAVTWLLLWLYFLARLRRRENLVDAHSIRAATNLRKASARWSIAYFSAGSISAKVRSWPIGWNMGS